MKKKLMSLACISVLGLGISMGSASAGGFEDTSGSYTYDVNEIKPKVTEYVGGGEWNHNVTIDGNLMKTCTSNYYHKTKKHSSTAQVGSSSQSRTDIKAAGITSKASYTNKYGFTARAYWNNDVK